MSTLGTVPERDKWSLGACPRKGQMVTRCLSQKDPKKIQPNRTKNLIAKNKVLG